MFWDNLVFGYVPGLHILLKSKLRNYDIFIIRLLLIYCLGDGVQAGFVLGKSSDTPEKNNLNKV